MIKKIENGNKTAIIEALKSSSPILQLNGLMFAAKYSVVEASEIIESMNCNDISFFGNPMNNFKIATLHLLGVDEYKGNDKQIKSMIDRKFGV